MYKRQTLYQYIKARGFKVPLFLCVFFLFSTLFFIGFYFFLCVLWVVSQRVSDSVDLLETSRSVIVAMEVDRVHIRFVPSFPSEAGPFVSCYFCSNGATAVLPSRRSTARFSLVVATTSPPHIHLFPTSTDVRYNYDISPCCVLTCSISFGTVGISTQRYIMYSIP